MIHHDKTADAPTPSTHGEPPKIYLAACGVLCDIFWWARRDAPAAAPDASGRKDETP